MNDFSLLIRSTFTLYRKAVTQSAAALVQYWWMPLVHLLVAGVAIIPLSFLASLLGMIGGFIAGLALAFLVALYLASLQAAHRKEPLGLVFDTAKMLFFPVIHVLFLFFIIDLVFQFSRNPAQSAWIQASVGLLLAVFGNVIPETIYIRGVGGMELFQDSFEFVIENWIEWFVPFLPLFAVLFFWSPDSALYIGLSVLKTHPFELLEQAVMILGSLAFVPRLWLYTIGFSYMFFFVALFRAQLFEDLAYSSRRKRIYAQRVGL